MSDYDDLFGPLESAKAEGLRAMSERLAQMSLLASVMSQADDLPAKRNRTAGAIPTESSDPSESTDPVTDLSESPDTTESSDPSEASQGRESRQTADDLLLWCLLHKVFYEKAGYAKFTAAILRLLDDTRPDAPSEADKSEIRMRLKSLGMPESFCDGALKKVDGLP